MRKFEFLHGCSAKGRERGRVRRGGWRTFLECGRVSSLEVPWNIWRGISRDSFYGVGGKGLFLFFRRPKCWWNFALVLLETRRNECHVVAVAPPMASTPPVITSGDRLSSKPAAAKLARMAQTDMLK